MAFILLLSLLLSSALVTFMLPKILLLSLRKRLIDPIDARKVHSVPASRLGGVTFLPAIFLSFWVALTIHSCICSVEPSGIVFIRTNLLQYTAFLALFMVGIFDDVIGVAYRKKFVVQICASLAFICSGCYFTTLHGFFGVEALPIYIAVPFTLFVYVFVINALNLIDGIDGLASLLSIMALVVYGTLLYRAEDHLNSILAFASLGALIPFCYSNILGVKRGAHSKIFMGDTGSLVVGAILGVLAIRLWNINPAEVDFATPHICYIFAFTMLVVPCFDVVRVVISRMCRRRPLFMPDKSHIHHKFLSLGLSARQSLFAIIVLNLCFMALNLLLAQWLNFTFIFVIDLFVWAIFHVTLVYKITKRKQD